MENQTNRDQDLKILAEFSNQLAESQVDLDAESNRIINENFWELI